MEDVKIEDLTTVNTEHIYLLAALDERRNDLRTQESLYEFCLEWSYFYALHDAAYKPKLIMEDYMHEYFTLKKEKDKRELRERVPAINEWFRSESRRKLENKTIYGWLNQMLVSFEEKGDAEKAGKVREVMNGYVRRS